MHVLITGGAGFIGSHLVEYHINKGDHVHVIDDLSTGSLENIKPFTHTPNFRFEQADILISNELDTVVAWADRIYHMAAVTGIYRILAEPIRVLAINIAGCERLLRAVAAGGWRPRVILASSAEVYGPSKGKSLREDGVLSIESGARNRWNYAISKLADEAFGLSYARKLQLPITVARLFNTIGPRQVGRYGKVVPRFIHQATTKQPLTIYGDGTQARSFCDVRDVVAALNLLADNPDSIGEIVNVGNDHEVTIKSLAELIRKLAKSDSPLQYIPYHEAYGEEYEEIHRRRPDLTKLFKLTHFRPQWTLEQTLEDLVLRSSYHESLPPANKP